MDILNLGLAFLEGLAIVISPCILPVLPILLSTGIDGGKLRPYGLIFGFVVAFSLFTLLSRQLVQALGLDAELLRQISFYILIGFGIILLSESLSDFFAAFTARLSDFGQGMINRQRNNTGFWSGLLVGCAIGLVWTPCAGPILTAVIVQTIRQETDLAGALTILAFALGSALPMLILTLQGKKLMTQLAFFKRHSVLMRKAFGVLIILTVIGTAQGTLSPWNFSLAGPQAKPAATKASKPTPKLVNRLAQPYAAPEFSGLNAWINTQPLTMKSLKGKVVLIDFWTYSCINCVRTLPYITSWDRKYRDQGLVIVGVHAPEFEFEKKLDNVKRAVAQHHIQYPVALDNHLDTWTNFRNQYWPAHYLIDREGRVVYTHFGEGEYATTESNIRALLGVGQFTAKDKPMAEKPATSYAINQTPETYLGYARAQTFFGTPGLEPDQVTAFSFPGKLPMNRWALKGKWFVDSEKVIAQEAGAALRLHFWGKKVFLVMGVPPKKSVAVKILLNGKPVKTITVNQHTLYTLLDLDKAKPGTLELQAASPGLSAYAFTFGS
ncbi:cytochrome c biogenesis protein DipZ [Vampirovibrio sp.]|uniref:cytochrome c biogenesis protein DipZ n=1 Tax=Vampirovibrio sp. TaxID=2717857 RepID=UPI003593D385